MLLCKQLCCAAIKYFQKSLLRRKNLFERLLSALRDTVVVMPVAVILSFVPETAFK